jgi:hypothetical protein
VTAPEPDPAVPMGTGIARIGTIAAADPDILRMRSDIPVRHRGP